MKRTLEEGGYILQYRMHLCHIWMGLKAELKQQGKTLLLVWELGIVAEMDTKGLNIGAIGDLAKHCLVLCPKTTNDGVFYFLKLASMGSSKLMSGLCQTVG
ncbi:hypothetical protein V6N13_010864 [Hibiscus sabdariffa]|uniref:Uncharacterized protein n=1 Tax=Hibiscus sabdariffa TaxID=183260 RepID=A0ABR2SAJ5_9ROSI